MTIRRRGAVATFAAAVVALAALTVPLGASDATTTSSTQQVYAPNGWLTLQTSTPRQVALDLQGDGTPDATQPLAAGKNCLLSTNESLLAIDGFVGTSTTDRAAIAGDDIGVAEKSSGTSCSQVGAPNERLVLTLNPTTVKGSFGPLAATSALLDMELKQNARILATAKLGGQVVGQFELQSGAAVGTTTPLPGGVTPDATFTCTGAADSGPDSGTACHCRWAISSPSWTGPTDNKAFDSLTLQAVSGSFSLDGGGDGMVKNPPPAPFPQTASFFELGQKVDGTIACGGSSDTRTGSGTAPTVTVTRLDNADPSQPCSQLPYLLTNGDSSAQFLKPSGSQGSAQFVINLVWTLPASAPLPLPVTTVDYESADPRAGIALGWCPDPQYSGTTLTGITDPLNNAAAPDQDDVLTGKQFSCLGSQSAHVVDGSPDTVQVAEQVYVLGDLLMRK